MVLIGKSWGGIPNDLITFFHIEGGFLGVIILSSILGIIAQKIDVNLGQIKNNNNRNLLEGIITIYYFQLICNADFITILKSNFMITIFSILVIALNIKRRD